MALPALSKSQGFEDFLDEENKVLSPSDSALDNGQLFPCPYCGRTFLQKALERHMKICQKVSTKKRNVFDLAKKRTEGLDPVPASKEPVPKRKIVKAEDEFQKCPICGRKFGDKVSSVSIKLIKKVGIRSGVHTSTPRRLPSPTSTCVHLRRGHNYTFYVRYFGWF